MRKILFILILSFMSNVQAVSIREARSIYNKLLKVNHIVHAPELHIVDYISNSRGQKDFKNAGTGFPWTKIYYTKELLNSSSADQVAFVLAHELGHITGRHFKSNFKTEYEADAYGKRYLKRLKEYNVCEGMKFLKNDPATDHPSGKDRLRALGC